MEWEFPRFGLGYFHLPSGPEGITIRRSMNNYNGFLWWFIQGVGFEDRGGGGFGSKDGCPMKNVGHDG
jgi:hypothetical protein